MRLIEKYRNLPESGKLAVKIIAAILGCMMELTLLFFFFEYSLALLIIVPGFIAFFAEALKRWREYKLITKKTMKRTAYIRVSTETQSYDRQRLEFETYFKNRGIDPRTVEFVKEKIPWHTSFRQRTIYYKVLKKAESGDIVYARDLDDFGTGEDAVQLMLFADSRDVILTTLDGYQLTHRTNPLIKRLIEKYRNLSESGKLAVKIIAVILGGMMGATLIYFLFDYFFALLIIVPGFIAFFAEALKGGAN